MRITSRVIDARSACLPSSDLLRSIVLVEFVLVSEGRLLVMSPKRRVPRSRKPSIYTPSYRRERLRRLLGWLLVGAGSVMALVHIYTHLARLSIIGFQDLLLGYPMAGMLVLAGFVLVGWASKPTR